MRRVILYSCLLSAMGWGGTIIFEDHLISKALQSDTAVGPTADPPPAPAAYHIPSEEELTQKATAWLQAGEDPLSVTGELLAFFPPPPPQDPPRPPVTAETPVLARAEESVDIARRQADHLRRLEVSAIVRIQGQYQAIIGGETLAAGDYVVDSEGTPIALVESIEAAAVHLKPLGGDGIDAPIY